MVVWDYNNRAALLCLLKDRLENLLLLVCVVCGMAGENNVDNQNIHFVRSSFTDSMRTTM